MARYNRNPVKKLKDGRVVYKSRSSYSRIPKLNDDVYIVTQEGDRLDTIAYQFYNDSSLWYIIAYANNIHDPSFAVEDGTTLRIPKNYQLYI
jgi:nucleoid-associated protein YgaU